MRHTVVIAPTIVIITPAIADMIALIPLPIAENIEPCITNDIRPCVMEQMTTMITYHDE